MKRPSKPFFLKRRLIRKLHLILRPIFSIVLTIELSIRICLRKSHYDLDWSNLIEFERGKIEVALLHPRRRIGCQCCKTFFKKWANPATFSFIFGLFKQTIQFLQKINVKKSCPCSIRRRDSNP